MKILIVGSGGREHALAWKLSRSGRHVELFIAPGNAGTGELGTNIDISQDDVERLAGFVASEDLDLVIVGPEGPLAAGLGDEIAQLALRGFPRAGSPAKPLFFGPSKAAARIESSKAFAKNLMRRCGIPTADFQVFTSYPEAKAFVKSAPWPFVIKASGLAAGKGVFLPFDLDEAERILKSLLVDAEQGEAGKEIVIEERLSGQEVSLMAFCDGTAIRVMPTAQDHKRLMENDLGPNTGGMGAVSPAPGCDMAVAERLAETFIKPAVRALAEDGIPYRGVLFAGLILTPSGPKALEYNCRLGDPEAQTILPLLKTDIIDIFEYCALGRLDELNIEWEEKAAASVVLASREYALPRGHDETVEAKDWNRESDDVMIFHAATRREGERLYSSKGRILSCVASAGTLSEAIDRAYSAVARIEIPGARYRRDIGHAALEEQAALEARATAEEHRQNSAETRTRGSYETAGVDIDAGDKAVELMSAAVRSTYGPEVLAGIGSFGGMYDSKIIRAMREPVLVSSIDGVGTKVKLASLRKGYRSVGMDMVNHSIDDILVQGARPLFFLDYYASSKLDPQIVAEVVAGMAAACSDAGCALIGGETAEMPGVYLKGEFDIAGAIVGIVEKSDILPLANLVPGDVVIGLGSSGLHTNGYSLVRAVFGPDELEHRYPELGRPLIDALLEPHRSYLPSLLPILSLRPGLIKALAHITGGGMEGNIPRILPSHLDAVIDMDSWEVPRLFKLIAEKGDIPEKEMFKVFNMGIGMVAIVAKENADELLGALKIHADLIGTLQIGSQKVRLTR
jgi:phosphoribosylamine--glycine ligase/phosphoribosylformylglycinamidine cyclo-ligase